MDNKPESVSVTVRIPYLSFIPSSCTMMLVFNVGFREKIKLQMKAPIVFQFETNFSKYSLLIQGSLQF